MTSGIIKVEASVIGFYMENIQKLLHKMQVDFICASKNTRIHVLSGHITRNHSSARAFLGVLRMRTARSIICRYIWIAHYTIIVLVHKTFFFISQYK